MKETDSKKIRQIEFIQQHTMTHEDQLKLIQEKLKRAQAYSEALRKREALLERR